MEAWTLNNPIFESDNDFDAVRKSYWTGHRWFAYDLVNFIKPTLIVELGVDRGVSFFAFCQAVKDFQLKTDLVGIDMWHVEGSDLGDNIFALVRNITRQYYKVVSPRLVRNDFLKVVNEFDDGSIDILHIDGDHAYDSVRKDYETWIRKVGKNGIILFHDVAAYAQEGSLRFWSEIKLTAPYFEFQNSAGLGVLFPKGDLCYQRMIKHNFIDKIKIYEYRSEAQVAMQADLSWQKQQTNKWWEAYQKMKQHYKRVKSDLSWQRLQTEKWWREAIDNRKQN